jgi:pimeloyl-ACP methyl ester carboxylesterase
MNSILKRALLPIACFFVSFAVAQAPKVNIIQGTTASGSGFEFDVPLNWNGNLVVYLHGITDPAYPLMLPSQDPETDFPLVRDGLLQRGFAVAASSWKSNGYALKDAVQQTHQLRGLFVSNFGLPKKTIIAGKSLGALAATRLVETYTGQYNGALLSCGPLAGSNAEMQYMGDERVLFDLFFPGIMPGDVNNTESTDFSYGSPLFMSVYTALYGGFFDGRTLMFAYLANLQATNADEIMSAAMTGMGFSARYGAEIKARTNGHNPYGNTNSVYGSADNPVNVGVGRFTQAEDAFEYLEHNYTPTGNLQIPVVTLHTTLDPVVPFPIHEPRFAKSVADQNASQWLVQRSVNRFGHCAMKPEEILGSFDALWTWVNDSNARPSGGDVTVP